MGMSGDRADAPDSAAGDGEEQWDISLDDLREREEADELAELREADPEPGRPTVESVAFVLLGVAVCVLLLYVGFL